MCSNNRINYQIKATHQHRWTLRFWGWNPMWEKPLMLSSLPSFFIIMKNFLELSTNVDSYQHAGIHLRKSTTFSQFPSPTRMELQVFKFVYWHPPEGRFYHLIWFTKYHWKEASNILLKAPTLNTFVDHIS